MAKAITTIEWERVPPEQQTVQRLSQVADDAAEAADALRELIRWIRRLHEKGLLQAAIAVLEQGEEIMKILVRQASEPEYALGLKNAIGLVSLLGDVNVEMLRAVASAATEAKARLAQGEVQPVNGVFPLLAALRDPDVGTGLAWALEVLRTLGKAVTQPDPTQSATPAPAASASGTPQGAGAAGGAGGVPAPSPADGSATPPVGASAPAAQSGSGTG